MRSLLHRLAALAVAVLLAACGGTGHSPVKPVTLVAAAAAGPGQVPLEGCALGLDGRALVLPVFASGGDGHLLASVMSDDAGIFRMHVPARTTLRLAAGTPTSEPLVVLTGNTPLTITGCLRLLA
jgi:hypothetical protein